LIKNALFAVDFIRLEKALLK
jgi:hypothetical protein